MMKGINNYYGLNQTPDILLIGHSHLMLATDKNRLEKELGLKVSKYCREGANVTDKKIMVNHFFNRANTDSLKFVLYGVDLATFTGDGLSKNSYKLFYPFIDDNFVNSYIKNQAESTDFLLHKIIKTTRFNDDVLKNSAIRGWSKNWDNLKNNTIDIDSYKKHLAEDDERHIQMNKFLIDEFKETIKNITDRGIRVILINTPTLDLLNNFEPNKYNDIINWFHDYANENPLVEFWDFNPDYQSDYSIFADKIHLNQKGQQIITAEIIKKLRSLNER